MSPQDLTTLAALKAWLGLPSTPSPNDATLTTLITAASRSIYATLARPGLVPTTYVEMIDAERTRVFLRHWPVQQIDSVTLDGMAVPAAAPAGVGLPFGYLIKPGDVAPPGAPQALDLFGWRVRRERQNLTVSYLAGYGVQGETQTVPPSAAPTVTAIAPYGPWAVDLGVRYAATGAPFAAVGSSPAVGQYCVSAGVYSFSTVDARAAISISYGFIPQDIVQAAIELAAFRFRAADRIGLSSKSVGGQETIAYDLSAMPASIVSLLQPYRRVAI